MECQRIRDITQRQTPRTIEVRVLRKWISKGKKEELCYQLVDAYGDCIEAVAEVKHIEHFDSVIRLQSCYRVTSLVFGRKARLHRTRVEKNLLRGREVKTTLWPEMRHLIGDDVVPGHIVAISSTTVTEHNESTYLTTIVVNPDMPQTIEHVHRLRALPPMPPTETHDKKATILDLKLSSQQNIQSSRNFICEAQIKEIHEDRGWYYVLCSKCSSKIFPQQDNCGLNFVCKDDDDIIHIFRYSVNATIADATGSAEAVFFNESMQTLLNISCKDMVTEHADTTNPKIVPRQLRSTIDKQSILYLTLKNDGKIAVNNASKVASTTSDQTTSNLPGTSTFTPTTPVPKSST
ncbi:hypothetical protein CASFOL_017634 [Castilleja foliolosa]|uniref:Replication factor A C-terminal domain-containing protein n=1 Tax=Castilleja foliolosa TaxID=1961234 RepID=A0ABD3D7I6_9LAMI